jgi:hypothetical protein
VLDGMSVGVELGIRVFVGVLVGRFFGHGTGSPDGSTQPCANPICGMKLTKNVKIIADSTISGQILLWFILALLDHVPIIAR